MPRRVAAAGAALALIACGGGPERSVDRWSPEERALLASLSPPAAPPPSPGNQYADDPAAAALGRRLFVDRRLSSDGTVSCADCHVPERGFTDGLPRAIGRGRGSRNTPGIVGAAHQTFYGWDGRWDSLWSQALAALEDPAEHGTTRTSVAIVIRDHHREAWEAAFGPLPDLGALPAARPVPADPRHPHHQAWRALPADTRDDVDRIFVTAGKALEAWQRTLPIAPSPFDRYVQAVLSGDATGGGHLSASAEAGLRAFLGPGQCVHCHGGPLLSDRAFHVLGLPGSVGGRDEGARLLLGSPFRCGTPASDAEACPELEVLDPDLPAFVGAFRTPSLRGAASTAPYMHGGQLRTLEEVVDFYRELPGEPESGERDPLLQRIDPAVDTFALVDFLRALDP